MNKLSHFIEEARSYSNEMFQLLEELFPINRSITGPGVRETIDILSQHLPLEVSRLKTGKQVFDWTIPPVWSVNSATISDIDGNILISLENNNLHLMSYSIPVDAVLTKDKLFEHITTDSTRPDAIPYATTYYKKEWGFCISYNDTLNLNDEYYKVSIDSSLEDGFLEYAEVLIDNGSDTEILISSYLCHPSMANDSISGVVIAVFLYKLISQNRNFLSGNNVRILFAPETIGVISYLSDNRELVKERTIAGLVLTCLGDKGNFNYKKTFNGGCTIDKIAENILRSSGYEYSIRNYSPLGSDERQYCSPGFRLPVGVLTRSMFGEFPEYHSSLDNLDFVDKASLAESLEMVATIVWGIDNNKTYKRTNPFCEPHLSKYNLYPEKGGNRMRHEKDIETRMWLLNLCDGKHSMLEISDRLNVPLVSLIELTNVLIEVGLLSCQFPEN
jgi:aminopeptidase-like protein